MFLDPARSAAESFTSTSTSTFTLHSTVHSPQSTLFTFTCQPLRPFRFILIRNAAPDDLAQRNPGSVWRMQTPWGRLPCAWKKGKKRKLVSSPSFTLARILTTTTTLQRENSSVNERNPVLRRISFAAGTECAELQPPMYAFWAKTVAARQHTQFRAFHKVHQTDGASVASDTSCVSRLAKQLVGARKHAPKSSHPPRHYLLVTDQQRQHAWNEAALPTNTALHAHSKLPTRSGSPLHDARAEIVDLGRPRAGILVSARPERLIATNDDPPQHRPPEATAELRHIPSEENFALLS